MAGRRGMKNICWDGRIRITTGITSTSKITISQTLFMTAYTILSCTRPGSEIPYPPTDVTTTRNTRKPNHHWRWWRRTQQKKRQLLYCRVDLLYTSLFPLALSRMHRSTTSLLWMSTVHLRLLLSMSTETPSIWLSWQVLLKSVTSTIVGDIVTNSFSSLTCAYHAFHFFLSFAIDMHFTQGWHAFLHMFTSLLPYVLHMFASRQTPVLYLFKSVVEHLYSLAFH